LQKELVKSQSLQLCECLSGKALRKVTRDVLAESPGEVKRMKQKTHCLGRKTMGGLLSYYFPCCYLIIFQGYNGRKLKFGCINMASKPAEMVAVQSQ